jgi:hypothetical protein
VLGSFLPLYFVTVVVIDNWHVSHVAALCSLVSVPILSCALVSVSEPLTWQGQGFFPEEADKVLVVGDSFVGALSADRGQPAMINK